MIATLAVLTIAALCGLIFLAPLWAARQLRAAADWLDDPSHYAMVLVMKDELYDRALTLTRELADHAASGEYKRHRVYARLIKEFPQRAKQELALVIEMVLRS